MPLSTLLPAGAWLWDKYGKSLIETAASGAKDRWKRFTWDEASKNYRAKVNKLYGTTQIMGMVTSMPLDHIFTDAYILDRPTAFTRFAVEKLKNASQYESGPLGNRKRVNGLRMVVEKGNLYILGKPGAGKTTFLKYIAMKAADQTIDKVPIFVELKRWADSGLDLMAFIIELFNNCDFPDPQSFIGELLKYGDAIVLFDGLDEINVESGQRDKHTREMTSFIEKFDRIQYLITCRIAASDYSFKPFTYVEMADFTEKQMRSFVGNWFRKNGEKDEETSRRFLDEFEKDDNKGLRELARTPLLLTLLCLAFQETLSFPQRRAEIYQEAVDALLKKWDSTRNIRRDEVYRKLSPAHKENMFEQVAAETFDKNQYFIAEQELARLVTDYIRKVPPHDENQQVDGSDIINAIESRHGIFVEQARGIYSFSHLSLQEYFAAKYIVANSDKGTIEYLIPHSADSRWREVFLLTASLLPDASRFTEMLRQHVDDLIVDDEKLVKLLDVSDKHASSTSNPWAVRLSYLFITFYYGDTNDQVGLALAESLALDETLQMALVKARELDSDLELAMDLKREFNRNNARDLFVEPGGARVRAATYESAIQDFIMRLAHLSTNSGTPKHEIEQFADRLRTFVVKRRDKRHTKALTDEQEERFVSFLKSTRLLQDCLELVVISPAQKNSMLSSLYASPTACGAFPGGQS